MKVILTPTAEAQIERQLAFGIEQYGHVIAERTLDKIERFFSTNLAEHPAAGIRLVDRGICERSIPRTPFVTFYRIEHEAGVVRVLGFYHHAQNRAASEFDGP